MKFYEYYEEWVQSYKSGSVSKYTLAKYLNDITYLKRLAPDLELSDLTRGTYQDILDRYAETHEKVTVKDFHTHLKACIADAAEEQVIPRNVAIKAAIKGKEPTPKKIKYLSQFEMQCLIRSLDLGSNLNYDWMILLLAKTGMRFAECAAITPSDFDFEHQVINVTKTLDHKNQRGGWHFMPTKNHSSERSIPTDWQTMSKFSELIKNIPENKPIFIGLSKADVIYGSTVNSYLEQKCKEAKVPVITPHGLRHTHASILLANGVSLPSVSKRLGHADTTVTQRVYAHIIAELENKDYGLALSAMLNLGM